VSIDSLGVIVLLIVFVTLLTGFVAFFFYSRTPAWRTSEVRMATMRLLVILGPFFGFRHEMPEPTPTSVSTPGPDPEPQSVDTRFGQAEPNRGVAGSPDAKTSKD
jgi:hypothetical protein